MYKPSLKSNWSLAILAGLSILLFYIAQTSYTAIKSDFYEEKIQAAEHMQMSMEHLRRVVTERGYDIDTTNDPLKTGLIGLSGSEITTSRGVLNDKLLGLNPNFSAVFVDMLKRIGARPGDKIAVGVTGANPGLNLAFYSAAQTLGLEPVIVTSVGSSMFGANRPDFTWLDIERELFKEGLIDFTSIAASIGGNSDIGRGLPIENRQLIIDSIDRNEVPSIVGSSLEENIEERMSIYNQHAGDSRYRAFVNIGGGLANVGSSVNARLVYDGINRRLQEREFAVDGVMMFFARRNTPIIHFFRPDVLADSYGLQKEVVPAPEIGTGPIYLREINNPVIAWICFIILFLAIIAVIIYDRHDRHFTTNIVKSDEELL